MDTDLTNSSEARAAIASPSINRDFWPVDNLAAWKHDPLETLKQWLAQLRVAKVRFFRESSTETYTTIFSAWVAYLRNRRMNVLEATSAEAHDFFASHALEPVSRRRYLQLLDRVYAHLERCGRSTTNPMLAELALERELERSPPPSLTNDQVDALLLHLEGLPGWKGQRDRAIAALLLGAGLRTTEAIHQSFLDVDANYAVQIQSRTVHRSHHSLILPEGPYRAWFDAWIIGRQEQGIPGHLVIPSTRKGLPFEPSGLFRRTKSWLTDAGVTAAQSGPNLLRSTFARHALACGRYELHEVQEFLGHETGRATEKHRGMDVDSGVGRPI